MANNVFVGETKRKLNIALFVAHMNLTNWDLLKFGHLKRKQSLYGVKFFGKSTEVLSAYYITITL